MPKTTQGKTTILKTYGLRDPYRRLAPIRPIRKPHAHPVQTSVKDKLKL